MAKTFGQYTGGIQAIQGINEFGAQQAAGIQRTGDVISGLITQGFKDYNDNKSKREVTTAKGAGLYESLKFMQANIRDNPELGQFADRFEPLMKKFSQFESMSTNQQAGFLIEAEAFEKSITPNLALYEKGLVARTKQGVQDALSKEVKIPDNQGGYVKGTPFSTTDTIEQNLALARKSFEVQAKTGGLTNFDINSALEKLTTQWENGFANDPNMAKNDPALRDAILKNISDYRVQNKLAGNLAGQTSEEYGTGENIISQVMALGEAQQAAGTSAAKALENKDMAAMLAAQGKDGVSPTSPDETSLANFAKLTAENVNKQTAETAKAKKEESTARDLVRSAVVDVVTKGKAPTQSNMYTQLDNIKKQLGLSWDGDAWIDKQGKNADALAEQVGNEYTSLLDRMGFSSLYKNITSPSNEAEIAKQLKTNPELQVKILKSIPESKAKSEALLKESQKLTAQAPATAESILSQPSAANKYAKTFDFNANIQEGVKEGFRQETFAEEKERVRQWFVTNNKGIIPSSLDEVYSSIRPETSVRFMPAPDGGQVMITPKGAQYIPPVKTTALTDEAISKQTLYRYGTRTADGTIIPEERAKGSGIKLAGVAMGGEESAKEFKKLHDDTVKARILIPKLLAMYKQGKVSRTLIPQAMWGDAESLLAQLKAAIRVETVGTGPVALPEHMMILERIGDPRKFFQFDTVGEAKLNSIMKSMEDALVNNSAGVKVTISSNTADRAGSIQQARIEAARAK